jgi:UDPglucose 6-dehydrogenase
MDNIFIERLWRSLKYEEVYLHAYASVAEAKVGIAAWLGFYNPASLHPSLYEPGLEALVAANTAAGRLSFTAELLPAIEGADAVFIAVGTPSRRGDGHADLSYVFAAAGEIGRDASRGLYGRRDEIDGAGRHRTRGRRDLRRVCPSGDFDVASNPEFLREGSAIEDFMRPDRVVIGADSDRAREVMRQLYRPLYLSETPMLFTDIETAELIKYAANAFLATKITFINEIADLCERVGADVQDVARGIGLDGRIGRKFLHAGPGFGGSCFPKDCTALVRTAREAEAGLAIVETVVQVNEARKTRMADKIIAACGGTVAGKRSPSSASPSSPTPTTCATARASPSCRASPRRARRSAPLTRPGSTRRET